MNPGFLFIPKSNVSWVERIPKGFRKEECKSLSRLSGNKEF